MVRSQTNKRGRARALAPVVAMPREFTTLALRCPVCNTEFTSEIPVYGEPEARDTDLRPRFGGVDPLPTLIHACPSCRFTAYREGYDNRRDEGEEDFEPLTRALGDRPPPTFGVPSDEELADLRRWIRRGNLAVGLPEGRDPFGAERYLLGARCYEYLKDDDVLGLADYFLRAAWCARASGDRETERSCQRDAATRFQEALDQLQVPESDRARVLYLIGELSRRSGDFARAVDAFTQLEGTVDADEEEDALFDHLARRQLALATVKSDVIGRIVPEELQSERD